MKKPPWSDGSWWVLITRGGDLWDHFSDFCSHEWGDIHSRLQKPLCTTLSQTGLEYLWAVFCLCLPSVKAICEMQTAKKVVCADGTCHSTNVSLLNKAPLQSAEGHGAPLLCQWEAATLSLESTFCCDTPLSNTPATPSVTVCYQYTRAINLNRVMRLTHTHTQQACV